MIRPAFAIAIGALLAFASQPVIMPTRRRELEPGFDLNQLLDDAGNRMSRAMRKAFNEQRMREVRYRAFTGEQS